MEVQNGLIIEQFEKKEEIFNQINKMFNGEARIIGRKNTPRNGRSSSRDSGYSNRSRSQGRNITCFGCGMTGHI